MAGLDDTDRQLRRMSSKSDDDTEGTCSPSEIRDGLQEGDIVVARAGALLREGDPVRAVTASADPK